MNLRPLPVRLIFFPVRTNCGVRTLSAHLLPVPAILEEEAYSPLFPNLQLFSVLQFVRFSFLSPVDRDYVF